MHRSPPVRGPRPARLTRWWHNVEFFVSDDHAGLTHAVTELLFEAVWLRCYVHLLRNALDYLPRTAESDLKAALQNLEAWLQRWAQRAQRLTD